jgi:hypothetical protein
VDCSLDQFGMIIQSQVTKVNGGIQH